MNKSGSCWQIVFEKMNEIDSSLEEFLEEYFDVLSCNYTDDNMEEYVGFCSVSFDGKDFVKRAKERNIFLPKYEVKLLESENWLKDYVIEFEPVETDKFLVYGVHEKEVPKTDKIAIKVYAATAFGSGHETTKACLNAMSYLNDLKICPKKVLDMGTGSGVLALAAVKLWKSKVTAVDIDEEAVLVTRQNALDNGLSDYVDAEVSDGYNSDFVKENAEFDVILSNILARPLIMMAEDLYKSLRKGGFCVLSGFNAEQIDWVVEEHSKLGLKLVKVFEDTVWRACVMEKVL